MWMYELLNNSTTHVMLKHMLFTLFNLPQSASSSPDSLEKGETTRTALAVNFVLLAIEV